jgi:Family of unknown function (DUF5719)
VSRRQAPPRRLPALLVVAGCIAAAAAFGVRGNDTSPAGSTGGTVAAIPTVAEPDAVSTSWYCAEGTGAPGGRADETILIANQGADDARAVVTVMPGGQNNAESRRVDVPRGAQVRVPVSSVAQTAEQTDESGMIVGPGVVVEVFGGRSVVEHEIDGEADTAVGPCARQAGRDWYFAAGTTERGAEQNAALFNPFPDDAIVDLTFATDAGFLAPADLQAVVVPRHTRLTVPIGNFVRRQAQVGVHVHVRTGRIVAEQSLVFTADNETRRGLTLSLGAPSPEPSWSLPGVMPGEGASHVVLVANFDTAATEVEITPRFEDQSTARPQAVPVGGRSVGVFDAAAFAGSGSPVGMDVRTTRPSAVVVEELAWWGPPAAGTGSATTLASPVPAPAWTFVVGRPTPEAEGTISVVNPGRSRATVTLQAYAPGGGDAPRDVGELALPAGRQGRFDLGAAGVEPDQVVLVRSSIPVVAVRRILGPSGASLALGVASP